MQRSFTNVLSGDVQKSSAFYESLLGMTRHSDIRAAPAGVIVTFVVTDCDEVYRKAVAARASVIEPPTDMPFGQRRMLLHDPDCTVLDVSAPTAPVV